MPQNTLLEAIASRRLVCDGGMGTQLMLAGLEQGGSGEAWNISHPERILEIQKRYVDAGADCIISNTFGASRLMLKRHGVADDLVSINASAIRIAREAFGDREGYVLGDMGPLGAILEPYGELPYDEAVDALTEQAKALVEAGADALIIETQTGIEEVGSGIEAAKAAGASCIIASLRFVHGWHILQNDDGRLTRGRGRIHRRKRCRHRRPQLWHRYGYGWRYHRHQSLP